MLFEAFVPSTPRARILLIAALAALIILPGLRITGLAGYDDAVYAHEAKEMLRTGDWWNVRFNGELNFEYPPMFLWLDAVSMRIFGINDAPAKLPAALSGIGTILALYYLTRRVSGDETLALIAAISLATTQPFLKYAGHAMTDVPFTLFCTFALLMYVKGTWPERGGLERGWLLLAGATIGIAILTRSVLGLAPLVAIALDILWRRDWGTLRSKEFLGAVALTFLIPSIWMGSQYRLHGKVFWDAHLGFVFGKISGSGTGLLHAPSYTALGMYLIKYYWPWLPVAVAGIVIAVRALVRGAAPAEGTAATAGNARTALLGLVWAFAVLFPLGFAGTQYGRYVIPAFPPLALLSAIALRKILPERRCAWAYIFGCVALFAVACFAALFPGRERGSEIRTLAPIADAQTDPSDRIVLYTSGYLAYDYRNQFVWYSDRRVEHLIDLGELSRRIGAPGRGPVTLMIDRASYPQLEQRVSSDSAPARAATVLGESGGLILIRYP